jgi:probable H4MPT-linked C1 transfer pathway protein
MSRWLRVLGLDVGGAHIKVADGSGSVQSHPYPLWRNPAGLSAKLQELVPDEFTCLAATMTGELADCYRSKREGVGAIVDALQAAAGDRPLWIYLVDGTFRGPREARRRYREAAAANWHALATFAARWAAKPVSLLIDVGSTTCDVLPLVQGAVDTVGKDDIGRLLHGELVYTGIERTPVCALVDAVPYRGQPCPLAREVFATTKDVHLTLGNLAENHADLDTADGRPATRPHARTRLARCLCADEEDFGPEDARQVAATIADVQAGFLATGIRQSLDRLQLAQCPVLLSGHGDFLARAALERAGLSGEPATLTRPLGPHVARCATAHAIAVLARERMRL